MKPRGFAVLALVLTAGLCVGCSPGLDSAASRPDLDTLRAALTERDELERTYLLTSFLRGLGPEDLPAVLAEVEKHRVGITADEVRLLMLAWTRFDAPGAFAAARDWPTPWKAVLMEQAMHAWGFNDGRAALAECEGIEDEELQELLRSALVEGWVASHDRLGAAEYAATVPEGRRRNRLGLRLVGQTMRDGPEAVIAWADALPLDLPNDFKQTAFFHAAFAVARLDPGLVAPWYELHIKQPYSATALRNIASGWAQYHDALALLAWLETLPLEEEREAERADAFRAAFRAWATGSSGETEAWLESAPPSPTRNVAIEEFARATVDAAPLKAMQWIAQIEDEERRRKGTLRYTRKWFRQDPEAAQIWLAGADIPSDWRQQILNNAPRATPRRQQILDNTPRGMRQRGPKRLRPAG